MKFDRWFSPSRGYLTFEQMIDVIQEYTDPNNKANVDVKNFSVIIATDSQRHGRIWRFSTSVAVRRMIDENHGKGGIYFIHNEHFKHMDSIRQKIITEAGLTVSIAEPVVYALLERNIDADIRLHFDVSETGGSRVAVKDVKSMAMGSGFPFAIKPDAWSASYVSNKYTK